MRLPYPLAIVVILLGLMLVSCGSGTAAPKLEDVAPRQETVPPLIVPDAELQPGESLGFQPAPVGTPEPNPRLLLHIAPRDESTRKPVTAPVTVVLGGRVIGTGLSEYTFELPGVMPEPIELAVEVPGYERWAITLKYRLTNTRRWDLPVWLKPVPVVPATSAEL